MNFLLRRLAGISFLFLLIASRPIEAQQATPCTLPRFSQNSAALQAAAVEAKVRSGTDVVILCDETKYFLDASGRTVRTQYISYKIFSQKGADGWDGLVVHWEPWHQNRPVVRARVFTPDGTVHALDPSTVKDETGSDQERKLYSDARVLRAPLPAITPGVIVEQEEVISESEREFEAGVVERDYFGGSVPVQESRLLLDLPASVKLNYRTQLLPDATIQRTEEEGRIRVTFKQGPIEAEENPPINLPRDIAGHPGVTFSTGKDWQSVATAYAAIVDRQIADGDLKGEVGRILKGERSREGKIGAILQFLSTEIRYTGIEFGESAIVPHSPGETLKHKYGDCKDKASLMVAMLRAASIPAHVALLNVGSRQDVSEELPGMGMFDHAIVYISGNPANWVDVTDEYARIGQLPYMDQGRFSLVASDDTTGLIRVPEASASENLVTETREFFLSENGPARVVETTEPHGIFESMYRAYYVEPDNKDLKKNVSEYVKKNFLSDNLDKIYRTEPKNLAQQFKLTLEASKAKRGTTDLDGAVVAIRIEGLFERLPNDLLEEQESGKKPSAKDEPQKKPRNDDYELPDAFVTEWKYRIVPPAGFLAKQVPETKKEQLGPATYEQEFQLQADGSVQGVLRFDAEKRRMSAKESKELQTAVVVLKAREPILVWFESKAVRLRNAGKMKESLQAYRELVAEHPREALHHLQVAKALLEAGLGNGAREEAKLAVKLEPGSALAEGTLAEILENDLVGRRLRPGSDFAGAEEAFRAAVKLDPENKATQANLAILLEYNRWGLRYGHGAKLQDAVQEYRKLTKQELVEFGLQNNIAFALFYAGEYAEAQKEAQALNPSPGTLLVACAGVLNGPAAAVAEAKKNAANDQQMRVLLKDAGNMLTNLRKYELGAALLEAGTGGDAASDIAADALLFRRTRPHEQLQLANDPTGVALKLLLLQSKVDLTVEELRRICSRNGAPTLASEETVKQLVKSEEASYSSKARAGEFPDVGIDLSVARALPKMEGSDAVGYKVVLWGSASYKESFYVVKEDGEYKALATSKNTAGAALEILDRVNAGNLAGARVLLDWLREDEHLAIDDDPLSGGMFPRLWTKGKPGDAPSMKLAAATLLCGRKDTARLALEVLLNTKLANPSEMEKQGVLFTKLTAYAWVVDSIKAAEIGRELYSQYPESKRAFLNLAVQLDHLHKFDEVDRLVEDRRRRFPDEPDGLRRKVFSDVERGDYQSAHDLGKQLVASGKGDAWDMNNLAWHALFTGKISTSDLEDVVRAVELTKKSPGALHTLGCAYAELGKTKDARDVLLQAMDKLDFDEPEDNYWYAFGRIAEQYGERGIALEDYGKVKKPEYEFQITGSSYRLAQIRLAYLQQTATRASR